MRKWFFAGLLGVLACIAPAPARADLITGQITGVFGSSGTNIYSQGGVTIVFTGLGPGTIDTPTFASFGNFDVVTAPVAPTAIADTFTLTLSETAPNVDSVVFTGTFAGLLSQTQSSAFGQFNAPLTEVLAAGAPHLFVVTVLSADQGTPGRVNLGVPSFPNASITGSIVSVPEPGSMALMGIGASSLYGLAWRRRHRTAAA